VAQKIKKVKQKLVNKYRLVILNEGTYEERFSLRLSRLNVFVIWGLFSVFLIFATTLVIAYTPLKEYIPGYSSTKLKRQVRDLVEESDSLKTKLAIIENYTQAIMPVLKGEIKDDYEIDSLQSVAKKNVIDYSKLYGTKEDSVFREKVDRKDRFPIREGVKDLLDIALYTPLKGEITQAFNVDTKHFALDIVAKTGTPVKSAADGTVIFSEWTAETGYVIIVKHQNDYVTVYKHNGALLKRQGDLVKSGEVIASVGSTGELTTGPHLHFELWSKGYPLNPLNYIDFK